MTRQDPHEAYAELAAGHALSALEPEEEQAFLSHLGGCARCERELGDHRATLGHLAYAADAAEPPASLLEGIRAGVLASGRGVSFPDAPVDVPAPVSLDAARERRRAGAARLGRARAWTGVAAAAAAVIGLGTWNVALQGDRAAQDALSDRVSSAMLELGEEGTQAVALKGQGDAVVAVALVHGDRMSLLVDGLDANDTDSSTYVLWGQSRFGDVRPVAAFDVVDDRMDVRQGLQMQAGVADVTRLMVTHEQGRVAPPLPSKPLLASGDV